MRWCGVVWPAGQQDGGVNAKLRVWALPQRHRGSTQTPIPDARDLINVGRRVLELATLLFLHTVFRPQSI